MSEQPTSQTRIDDWGTSEVKQVLELKTLDHQHKKEIASHHHFLKKEDRTHVFACWLSLGILVLCSIEFIGNYAGKRDIAFNIISNALFLALGIILKTGKVNFNSFDK